MEKVIFSFNPIRGRYTTITTKINSESDKMIQEIIDNFKKFVHDQNWTITKAAEEIGCHRTHLSKIFHGHYVPSMTLLNEMEKVMKEYGNSK